MSLTTVAKPLARRASRGGSPRRKWTTERIIFTTLNTTFLLALAALMISPLLNTLAISLNDGNDAVRGGIGIWPRVFSLQNYNVVFNMTTRSGSNAFHGGANIHGTTPYFAKSRNVSPELEAQLLRNVPLRALAANPDISVSPDIQKDVDIGGWLAGPIMRDRLWFAATWRDQRLDRYVIGTYDPSGQQVLDDNVMWTTSAKISWQVNRVAQLSYFDNLQDKLIGQRAAGTFYDSLATQYHYKFPRASQV